MRVLTAFPYKERVGGEKKRRGRREAARERGNMRRYYERQGRRREIWKGR